ncbi:hypothetical protein HPB51_015392 [Rhipicephalus microplus]|uniref:Uncharacterized protein n=1 Tax=Rhipicephalus microplus TaxID=6941 RepID=A0A9J6DV27_RHIMP|nr:hypothetical protein HPB51_015392 [Rhipicephalus microplus]
MAHPLTLDSVWLDKAKYDDAEKQYLCYLNRDQLAKAKESSQSSQSSSLVDKIAQARQQIKNSLQSWLSVIQERCTGSSTLSTNTAPRGCAPRGASASGAAAHRSLSAQAHKSLEAGLRFD